MMLEWISYILILTIVLGTLALGFEQLSQRAGWATRWVWVGAVVATLVIPAALLVMPREIELPTALVNHLPMASSSITNSAPPATHIVERSAISTTVSFDSVLMSAWLAISGLMIAVLAFSWLRLRRAAASWTRASVAGTDVLISTDLGPAVVGFFPGRIVLPRWMLRADVSVQRMTVLHERQHLAARDPQLLLAVLSCVALMPWNLPLWWMFRRLRAAVEIDCDARVLRDGEDAVVYGRALLDVASCNARTTLLAPALIEPRTQLERRIRLLGTSTDMLSKSLVVTAAMVLLCIAGVAMAQLAVPQPLSVTTTPSKPAAVPGYELLDALLDHDSSRAIEMIDAGADLNYRRAGEGTPLIVAARNGDLQLVELLLTHGADANQQSLGDGNPLIVAAASGDERIARTLVAAGADVNAFVEDDETPLINAARGGHLNVVKYLLVQGANVSFSVIANKLTAPERRSALSEAEKHGHHDVANYLRANGAKS
ncbi:MAG: ankyrin repeat domain-containing protein [Steroidobacter sp.]